MNKARIIKTKPFRPKPAANPAEVFLDVIKPKQVTK